MVNLNQRNRNYYLNLFSSAAQITKSPDGTKNSIFKWNIRDLQLGSEAEIALIQMVQTNANSTTGYAIRCLETFADGFDSFNQTSAVLYLGLGMTTPQYTSYHKLIANNLNSISLVITDDFNNSSGIYSGIGTTITFGVILEITDYIDKQNTY